MALFWAISVLTLFVGSCSDEDPDEAFSAPEMTVSGTNNLGRTSATVSGQFSGKLSRVKEYGVKYSTSSLFPEDQTTRVSFEGAPTSGNFSAQLTNLNSNTQYYYCLYATTGSTEVTSDLGSFSTVSTSKPTFDEISLDSIGENVVAVRFRIVEVGDEYLVEQGVSYRKKVTSGTEESFVPMSTDSVSNAGEREYVAVIYNLTANTTYEIRPYAKNSSDASGDNGMIEGYGDTQTFTTEAQKSPLVVTDDIDSGNVGISSVVLSGMITSAPGSNGKLDEVGFCYSENRQEPTWLDNRLLIDNATKLNTTYTTTLTGLKENTTYYVRMYAKNTVDGSARYGYGETKQFTTSQLSTPIFDEFTNVSAEAQSITLTANLSNYDEGAIVEKGFYWATSLNDCTLDKAAILGHSMKVTDGGRAFSATITGLNVGVLYYVGAYAVYQSDQREATGYSDPYPITTSGFTVPVLNTPVISDENYFGATLTGVIRSQGNGQITSKGFVISRDYDEPTIDYCDFHAYADDNFQHTFTELTNGTFYYVRAYVVCELAGQEQTVYSDYTTFSTTAVESAVLKDLTVTDVTQNGAKFASGLNSAGDGEVTEAGFIWVPSADLSETLNLEKATGKQKVELTGSMDNFEWTLTNLKYSTEYKARAYVKTLVEGKLEQISYSGTVYFTTSDPQSASLSNFSYTNVSLHSIDVSIEIGSAGDGSLVEKGFCWVPTESINYWSSVTLDNAENHIAVTDGTETAFQATITGLTADTQYRIAAYVITELDGVKRNTYSEYRDVYTSSPELPSMNAPTVSNANFFDATFKLNMYNEGNYTITRKGICISSKTSEPLITDCEFVQDFGQDGSCVVTGLTQNTTYYVRSFAVCSLDDAETTTYSDTRTFSTSNVNAPQLGDLTLSNATLTGFDASTVIRESGDGTITEKGFCWIPTSSLSNYWDAVTLDNATGSQTVYTEDFSAAIANLANSTEYRVAAYVKYSMENQYSNVVYSNSETIWTSSPELPSISDPTCDEISYFSAKITFKLSSAGSYTITRKGICVSSKTSEPTLDNNEGLTDVGETDAVEINGLSLGTTYYARNFVVAQLDDISQTIYSGSVDFTTLTMNGSTFSQLVFSNISLHTIDVTAGIVTQGSGNIVEKGFCWAPVESINYWESLTLETNEVQHTAVNDGTTDSFSSTLSGLTANTNYRVVAYAKATLGNETKISYSEYRDVNTAAAQLPSMNAPTVSNVDFFDATFKLNMYDEGNYTITRKGVCLSATRSDPVINDCDYVQDFGQDNTCTVSQLKPGTTYYARSFAVCTLEGEETTTYSDARTFSTSEITAPSLKNITVSNILFTSFDAACGVRETGDGEITEKGFCWVKTSDLSYYWDTPTLENSTGTLIISNGDTDSFSGTASNLEMNVEYRVAAYVKYQVGNYQYSGVAYSESTSFNTAAPELPSLNIPDVSNVTYKAATFTYQLSSAGNYEITERGVVLSKSNASPEIYSHDATAVYGSDGTCTITGLDRETTYYYRSYAKCKLNYDEQVVYSDYNSFSTSSVEYPTLGWPTEDNVAINSADLTFNMMSEGSYQIIERGICVSSKTSSPSTSNYEYLLKMGDDGNTTFNLTGLEMNTTYYARCYVICQLEDDESTRETRYSSSNGFTTGSIQAATFWTVGLNSAGLTTANVYATIDQLGDGELVEKGFIWNYANDSEPTLDNCRGSVTVSSDDYSYEAELTGLPINTVIYVRAYAKTSYSGNIQVGYSGLLSFGTNSIGIHSISTSSDGSTATISYSFYDDISNLLKETGIVYSTDSSLEAEAMTSSAQATANENDSQSYSVTVKNLESSKVYYFYIYVKTEGGTSYFGKYDFSTKAIPGIDDISSPGKRD
jgi:hypothetical protein